MKDDKEPGDDRTTVTVDADTEIGAKAVPADTSEATPAAHRWLRRLTVAAITLTIVALTAVGYVSIRHRDFQTADRRTVADLAAARDWVTLFVTATDQTIVDRADEIGSRTTDPLHAEAMDRIEPYLEMLADNGSGHPLRITSAAVERDGSRPGRPPLPQDATAVLVTTTARSGQLGHGYALWLYVVERAGEPKIADFGGAG